LVYLRILLALLFAGLVEAQTLEIHSEFQRIDPFGHTVTADHSDYPREILSPELPRNAHSVFHVSVTAPAHTSYFLYVGSNPPIIQTSLYKEDFVHVDSQWIPDDLTPVRVPAFGYMPDYAAGIPGQTTRCYLLDIWVPPHVDVQRVRVEVLMKIGVWYVAPMEVRIVAARVPRSHDDVSTRFVMRDPTLPDLTASIDQSATESLARYLMGWPPGPPGGMLNIRDVVRRSAEQDMAIAREYHPVPQPIWFLAEDGILPHFNGPEWYLRVRDWIYRNSKGD